MEDFIPKDHIYVDKGQSTEDEGYIYMAGPTRVSICNLDGDRYIVVKSRLTKVNES